MTFLTRFYYLPFLIGIIISILLKVFLFDLKLRAEGIAKINFDHSLIYNDNISKIYWENSLRKTIQKVNNENLLIRNKRGTIRFDSKKNDIDEIKKNYQIFKNELNIYEEKYIKYIKIRFENELEEKKYSKKIKKVLEFQDKSLLQFSKGDFLGDLKTNEIKIHDYQLIYITLLISFFLSVILYNFKKKF